MSRRTQANRKLIIFSLFLSIFSLNSASAGPVADAQEKLNQAYDDYYDAVSTGGNKTPEQQKALRQRIVDPAMTNLNQAMKEEADQVIRDHAKAVPSAANGGKLIDSGSAARPAAREQQPEVTLDGTDIPKEIEFPGKGGLAPKTPPSVSPSKTGLPLVQPYLGPYAPRSQ